MTTTAEKIKVMQAFEDGAEIELAIGDSEWDPAGTPEWDWIHFNYRVAEKPPRDIWVIGHPSNGGCYGYATKGTANEHRSSLDTVDAVHYRRVGDE